MDVFPRRAGYAGGLAAEDPRLGENLLRAVGHVFRGDVKSVAVALVKAVRSGRLRDAALFFQCLRLFALVLNPGQQPAGIPGRMRVLADGQKVPAAQTRLVTAAIALAITGLMVLKGPLILLFTAGGFAEAAGVAVVFEDVPTGVGAAFSLQDAAGFFEVIIATHRAVGPGFEVQAKALDRRFPGHHPGVLHVRGRPREQAERLLFITEHQHMAVRRMPKMVVKTLFKTQALNKVQVRFAVLHAVLPRRVGRE